MRCVVEERFPDRYFLELNPNRQARRRNLHAAVELAGRPAVCRRGDR
ncbi:hypothetical protein ACNKHM_06590 [Shigella sonnei]